MLAHTQHQFLVFANSVSEVIELLAVLRHNKPKSKKKQNNACCHWCMRTCECVTVWAAWWVCALLSMWVHAYFFSVICNKRWTLISFGDICGSACHCICGYSHHSPSPYPPLLPPDQISLVSQLKTIGGGLPPSEHDGKTYDWRATARTFFVFVLIATCTMTHQDLTPGLAPSQHPCMQPHVTPTSSPPSPLHLVAISILAINSLSVAYYWASPQCLLRTAKPSTPPTRLGNVYKRVLVILPSSPHQRAFVCGACIGTAQVGVSLVSIFRSTLQTV